MWEKRSLFVVTTGSPLAASGDFIIMFAKCKKACSHCLKVNCTCKKISKLSSNNKYRFPGWDKLRLYHLNKEPMCRICDRAGICTVATTVDHIVPHRGDAKLFYDYNNLQSLCTQCHSIKTGRGE